MAEFQLTQHDVALLITQKVSELRSVIDTVHTTPIRCKHEAKEKIARLQELLDLLPDPSEQAPLEVQF